MPRLFNIAGMQRLEAGAGTAKRATATFLRQRAPQVTPPAAGPRISPQPVQMPNHVRMPQHKGPWDAIANGFLAFYKSYSDAATRLQDEKDRVSGSQAARQFDDEVRRITRGDHEDEIGYLYLDSYDAVRRKAEYESRLDSAFNDIANSVNPNARRYAAEKMLGYRRVALREISQHHLSAHRATQQNEKREQYQSFMRRLDDMAPDIGAAMAEIASYTLTLPDSEQELALSSVLVDYTDLIASKDPEIAFPLLAELQEKAEPAFDVDSQTNMNRRVQEVARRYNRERGEKDAIEAKKMVDFRHRNRLQMFKDQRKPGGPDIEFYRTEVEAGRMDMGHFNTLKRQWENRAHLPPLTAQEEFKIKDDYINGRISREEIYELDSRQADKDKLFDFVIELEADERQAEIKHYYGYVGNMVKSKPLSKFYGQDAIVAARNAQEAFRRTVKDPAHKMTLFESANTVLAAYGVQLTEFDKIPSLVIPGGKIRRPTTRSELIDAVKEIKNAEELGLIAPSQRESLFDLAQGYRTFIVSIEEREAEIKKKEAEERAREARPLGEKIKGLFGFGEEEKTETE